jgi:DsbC/DsbD-like thiol-disulfide interchange protein
MKKLLFLWLLVPVVAAAQLQRPVKWAFTAKKINAHEAAIYVKATMASGWHIYAMHTGNGVVPTSLTFNAASAYRLLGKITAPKPKTKFNKVLQHNLSFFDKEVVFVQKLKLLKPNAVVSGTVTYMVCSDKSCLPAEELPFKVVVK